MEKFGLAHGGDGGGQQRRQRRQCARAGQCGGQQRMNVFVCYKMCGISSGDVSCEEI